MRLSALLDTPLHLVLAGSELTIPSCRADLWLHAMELGGRHAMLAELLDDDGEDELQRLLLEGQVTADEIFDVANQALGECSGRDWWVAERQVEAARTLWDWVGGGMALGGVLPDRVTLCTWLDAAWWLIRQRVAEGEDSPNRLKELVDEVMAPLPSDSDLPEGVEAEMDEEAFFAAASAMAGPLTG